MFWKHRKALESIGKLRKREENGRNTTQEDHGRSHFVKSFQIKAISLLSACRISSGQIAWFNALQVCDLLTMDNNGISLTHWLISTLTNFFLSAIVVDVVVLALMQAVRAKRPTLVRKRTAPAILEESQAQCKWQTRTSVEWRNMSRLVGRKWHESILYNIRYTI